MRGSNSSPPANTQVRLLLYSSLFPNPQWPRHGVFVETRLRMLMSRYPVSARVVAPVPWAPPALARRGLLGQNGRYANVPAVENRDGLFTYHPRYPVIPGVSWHLSPYLLYRSTLALVRRLRQEEEFDIIDAHYLYPDGVAAVMLGRALRKPVVMTARGNDVSLLPDYLLPRKQILWACQNADAVITVCQALKDRLTELGASARKISVLRNGVDLTSFQPADRAHARAELGLEGRVLVSVGHLIERKGNHITIEALPHLPGVHLVLVGDGPEEPHLRQLADRLGVADRVLFAGPQPQHRLPLYYSAADAMVLASSREGWANVLLESMACGTPVLATAIWGTPEVVAMPAAGQLFSPRSAPALIDAYHRLMTNLPARDQTRRYAESFNWDFTSDGQFRIQHGLLTAEARRYGEASK